VGWIAERFGPRAGRAEEPLSEPLVEAAARR
jgi:hypothetical protein